MRLLRFVAGCATAAAVTNCSLALEGLGPTFPGDEAGLDVGSGPGLEADTNGGLTHPEAGVEAQTAAPDAPPASDAAQSADAGSASLCGNGGLLFCDDFENGAGAWAPKTAGATIAIDTTRAYRGTHSLHA